MRKLSPMLLGLFLAFNAQAAHRTFVAASGTDGGVCGPTTPCRSLEYAQSQTNSGGEIIIIQSGGYGNATGGLVIDRSISIIAEPGVFAALAPTSGAGITISTAGLKVVLKGLTINGRGGVHGIDMTDGDSLLVEKTTIAGFPAGAGLVVQAGATVHVVDSVIRDNLEGIVAGDGATVGVSGSKLLNHSSVVGNAGIKIRTAGTAAATTTILNVNDTVISGGYACFYNHEISGNTGRINASRVTVTRCSHGFINEIEGSGSITVSDSTASRNTIGFYNYKGVFTVSGSTASNNGYGFRNDLGTLTVSGSTASHNTEGFYNISGTLISLGNNTVNGNTRDIYGTITPAALQ